MLYLKFTNFNQYYLESPISFYSKLIRSSFNIGGVKAYLSIEDKNIISNKIPENYNEIMTGVMLGDGSIIMKGSNALLSIQQTEESLVNLL